MLSKPKLAITMGDVNGIGPEIVAKTLAQGWVRECCVPVVFGSVEALEDARRHAPDCPAARAIGAVSEAGDGCDGTAVLDGGWKSPALRPGRIDPEAGTCAVEWIKLAVTAALAGSVAGLVTGPISKACIHQAGYDYIGHTELVAEMTHTASYRMCLFTETMRIVHNTGHCSLREALDWVRLERISESIRIGHAALSRMGLAGAHIAVAGLNPHAGESGAFGDEEAREIAPAIARCKREGIHCSGPYPPDTVFRGMRDGKFDMVVAMYHDQGHIPLKLVAMEEGVNVTLGVPIVRTSVDHGTAFDIAGRGVADSRSMCAALRFALKLADLDGNLA